MELTVIHIPGKFGSSGIKKKSSQRHNLTSFGNPLRKKFKIKKSKPTYSPTHTQSKRKISRLERLPTELLERIFFYCLNFELPRSSPILGAILGSKSIYIKTLVIVFGPSWDRRHFCNRVSAPISRFYDPRNSDEDEKLQTAILRCRWASLSLILDAKRIWARDLIIELPFEAKYFNNSAKNQPVESSRAYIHPDEYLYCDFQGFTEITELSGKSTHLQDICWETTHDIAAGVQIPVSLLKGPWSNETLKYLFWAIKSGAEINWLSSTSGETALEGMRCAIMTGDIRAIYLLLWAGIRISGVNHMINQVVDGRKLLVWAPQNAGGNVFAVLNHLYTLTHNVISENYKMEILNELSEMKVRAHKRNQANLSWILPLNYLMRELMGPSN